jgi:hypothetical protein
VVVVRVYEGKGEGSKLPAAGVERANRLEINRLASQ